MIIDSVRNFIRGLDKKEFVLYAGAYIGVCLFIVVGIIVRHVYLVQDATEKIKQVNNARKSVQKILTDFTTVEQQRSKVESLLKKDKSFRIQKFFQDVAHKATVFSHAKEKFSKQNMEQGYAEESLSIHLTQITTKQLCTLLQDIENEPRVYIKFVDITKKDATKKINVEMTIATLVAEGD